MEKGDTSVSRSQEQLTEYDRADKSHRKKTRRSMVEISVLETFVIWPFKAVDRVHSYTPVRLKQPFQDVNDTE